MDDKNDLMVSGFVFASEEDAELARQECKKIEYLEKKMDYKMPENMLAVYNKILDGKLVQTPVGWDYLRKMQNQMIAEGIDASQISPIPLYSDFSRRFNNVGMDTGVVKQRVRTNKKEEKDTYQKRFQKAVIVSIGLAALVLAMFYITLKSENPNMLNYEKALINKYSAWEQELKEREKAVKEKEMELNE